MRQWLKSTNVSKQWWFIVNWKLRGQLHVSLAQRQSCSHLKMHLKWQPFRLYMFKIVLQDWHNLVDNMAAMWRLLTATQSQSRGCGIAVGVWLGDMASNIQNDDNLSFSYTYITQYIFLCKVNHVARLLENIFWWMKINCSNSYVLNWYFGSI